MSVILLADDSPHAQRMGERILKEEGYEVVSITDGETALLRLADVDPDLVIADVFLPGRSGFDLCRYVKTHHRHARVILTAGLLESSMKTPRAAPAATPFCASPSRPPWSCRPFGPWFRKRSSHEVCSPKRSPAQRPEPVSDAVPVARPAPPDPKRVEAAIALALDAAMPALIREITEKVLIALGH